MMTNPKAYYKHSDLFDKLNVFFGESMNLTRIKFISLMILALCKVQTVSFISSRLLLKVVLKPYLACAEYSALCPLMHLTLI